MNKNMKDPAWWSEEHSSAWDRVKAAIKRDWEQTKHDLTRHGRDLDQDVPDTVKQAVGSEPIPPGNQPNVKPRDDEEWERMETGTRFGFGARRQFTGDGDEWNERVETKLRDEWDKLGTSERWEQARSGVRQGWERAKPGDFRS